MSVKSIPKATHVGELHIGDQAIPCAVLEDGTRLLTQEGFLIAIGRSGKPAAGRGSQVEKVAPFLALENLKPFIDKELESSTYPVVFKPVKGIKAYGYRAELLPRVCEVYLKARDANVLLTSQLKFAQACDMLMRGLAHVGIIALVDEATGYQADRNADALQKLLALYLNEERLKWAKTFPEEFYKHIYRLWGWSWSGSNKRTPYVGKLTNELVYEKLPPGVLDELRRLNPKLPGKTYREAKFFQHLSLDYGQPDLRNHMLQLMTVFRLSNNKGQFLRNFARAFPSPDGEQETIDGIDDRPGPEEDQRAR